MHIIRLRGPWQKQCSGDQPIRVDVPDNAAADKPSVCYRRRFNRPSGLQSGDRVYLRITKWTGVAESIQLNGQPLSVILPPLSVEITSKMLDHNQLSIQLMVDPQSEEYPRLSGEVSLAIDEASET